MFKIIILTSLLSLPVTMASLSECEEAKQLENTCGKFCFKVVKPMIEHMTALQKKVNSHDENGNAEQSNFIKDIDQKLGIAEEKMSVFESEKKTQEQQIVELEQKLEKSEKKSFEQQQIFYNEQFHFKKNITDKLEQKFKLFEQKLIDAEEKILEQSKLNKNLSEKIALLESEKNEKLKEQQQNNEQYSLKKIIEEKFQIAENLIAVLKSGNWIKERQIAMLEQEFRRQKFIDQEKNKSPSALNYLKRLKSLEIKNRFTKIGSQYYYIEEKESCNWFEAAHRCDELGGHLASPQNEEEYNALSKRLNKDNYWIDINDVSKEGVFVSLTTGQNASYLNWFHGEPNNSNSEDCVVMNKRDSTYKMNDEKCHSSFYFVCQLFSE